MAYLFDEIYPALVALLEGRARQGFAERSNAISLGYRDSQSSDKVVRLDEDALAYALVRAPATYAAVQTILAELAELAPDFAPQTMLDVGAGPGTATWAALETWPGADATLVDNNAAFRKLAQLLATQSRDEDLQRVDITAGDMRRGDGAATQHDLVIATYALTELSDDQYGAAALRLWQQSSGALVLVEPGRPRDYQRLMLARDEIIKAGGKIVAPCPHAEACPLVGDDWCHFSVRLTRHKEHMRLKQGRMGYEDEKFSYLVFARPEIDADTSYSRIISPPVTMKYGTRFPVCKPDGHASVIEVHKADKAHKRAKKLKWGDRLV